MRLRIAVVVAIAGALPLQAAQLDSVTRAIMNPDGAWKAAAKSAASDMVTNGITVAVDGTGTRPCATPNDLLIAETEAVLRAYGLVVQDDVLAGSQLAINVVSLFSDRCITSLHMALTIDRIQNVSSDPYFGDIVVDDMQQVLVHPPRDHRDVLVGRVSQQVRLWAGELLRHRE